MLSTDQLRHSQGTASADRYYLLLWASSVLSCTLSLVLSRCFTPPDRIAALLANPADVWRSQVAFLAMGTLAFFQSRHRPEFLLPASIVGLVACLSLLPICIMEACGLWRIAGSTITIAGLACLAYVGTAQVLTLGLPSAFIRLLRHVAVVVAVIQPLAYWSRPGFSLAWMLFGCSWLIIGQALTDSSPQKTVTAFDRRCILLAPIISVAVAVTMLLTMSWRTDTRVSTVVSQVAPGRQFADLVTGYRPRPGTALFVVTRSSCLACSAAKTALDRSHIEYHEIKPCSILEPNLCYKATTRLATPMFISVAEGRVTDSFEGWPLSKQFIERNRRLLDGVHRKSQ